MNTDVSLSGHKLIFKTGSVKKPKAKELANERIQKQNDNIDFIFNPENVVQFDSVLQFKERQPKSAVYKEKPSSKTLVRAKMRDVMEGSAHEEWTN